LECPSLDTLHVSTLRQAGSYVEERDALAAARDTCLADVEATGVDLSDYHSAASAADLAALRVALGYDEWNILGISYGARLALATMRAHPEGIRSVILDSVYDVTEGGPAAEVAAGERGITWLIEQCAADPHCAGVYGDLGATIGRVRQRYNDTPAAVTADIGDGAGPQDFLITGDDMMTGLFDALFDAELIPALPSILHALAGGDTSVLPTLVEQSVGSAVLFADAMATAVNCADNAALERDAEDAAAYDNPGRLGVLVAQMGLCPVNWPPTPDDFNQPVQSDIPALVLAGAYDPTTPPDGSRAAAERLTNSTFVLIEPGGHAVGGHDDCAIGITLAFLDNPPTPPDLSCVAAIPPVAFA
jgi:pimeloyl-ACP methyl ester carboxylesterase